LAGSDTGSDASLRLSLLGDLIQDALASVNTVVGAAFGRPIHGLLSSQRRLGA